MAWRRAFAFFTGATLLTAGAAAASPITYVNNHAAWAADVGATTVIDFELLPDGSPSYAGHPITLADNYTAHGATFTAPADDIITAGNTISGFGLLSGIALFSQTSIKAQLVTPSSGVGVFFPGGTALTAYAADNTPIATVAFSGSGSGFFLGIVSEDVPISYAIVDSSEVFEVIESFHFGTSGSTVAAVPEPATLFLTGMGALALTRRRYQEEVR